jgi:hypothetical protein
MRKVSFNITEDASEVSRVPADCGMVVTITSLPSQSSASTASSTSAHDLSRRLRRMKRKLFLDYVQEQPSEDSMSAPTTAADEYASGATS